jgi:tetratricopeptide (TPR) repeat protein
MPAIMKGDVAAAITDYRRLQSSGSLKYNFNESELNRLGYQLLRAGKTREAVAIFKLNVEMYPEASNPYDSLGEAYAAAGNKELALENYSKSLELDPKNDNARRVIQRLEKPAPSVDMKYPLDAFVGRYQLAPGFVLSFFIEDGKLVSQATGQPKVGLTAESATEFAAIGVPARLAFHIGADGKATAVTLFQGGREMRAERVND